MTESRSQKRPRVGASCGRAGSAARAVSCWLVLGSCSERPRSRGPLTLHQRLTTFAGHACGHLRSSRCMIWSARTRCPRPSSSRRIAVRDAPHGPQGRATRTASATSGYRDASRARCLHLDAYSVNVAPWTARGGEHGPDCNCLLSDSGGMALPVKDQMFYFAHRKGLRDTHVG